MKLEKKVDEVNLDKPNNFMKLFGKYDKVYEVDRFKWENNGNGLVFVEYANDKKVCSYKWNEENKILEPLEEIYSSQRVEKLRQ